MFQVISDSCECSWVAVGTFRWADGMFIRWVIPTTDLGYITKAARDFSLDYIHTTPAYRRFDDTHGCVHKKFTTAFPVHSGRGTSLISTDEVDVSAFLTSEGASNYWNVPPYSVWVGVTNTNYDGMGMYVKQGYRVRYLQRNVYLVDRVIKTGFITSYPFTCTVSCSRQLVYWSFGQGQYNEMQRVVVATHSRSMQSSEAIALMLRPYDATFRSVLPSAPYEDALNRVLADALDTPYVLVPPNVGVTWTIFPPSEQQLANLYRAAGNYDRLYTGTDIYVRPKRRDFGKAVQAAIDDTKYVAINSIAYLKEAVEALTAGAPFPELIAAKDFASSPSLKGLASILLSYSYGTKLTIADTVELDEGIRKLLHSLEYTRRDIGHTRGYASMRFRENPLNITRRLTANVFYHQQPDQVRRLWDHLRQWDLEPSLENLYDLVPYSFVVDWFTNVGDILTSIDTFSDVTRLDLAYYVRSYQDQGYMDLDIRQCGVDRLYFSNYVREVLDRLDAPVPDLEIHLPGVSVAPQGLSLIIQRLG